MKKYSLFLIIIFLISTVSSFQEIGAQEKTKEEQEKDAKMQQSIEKQKKEMADQKNAQSEADQNMKRVEIEYSTQDALDNANKEREKIFLNLPHGNRSLNFNDPYLMTNPDMQEFFGHSFGGDAERTTWDFSKSVKDNTFSGDYTFDVEKTAKTVVMSVMGDCKSGDIRIKIVMPNGKNYSDILIDESGNLNWRKSFTISESENQDKTGSWKFQISSAKATGFFKVSLQTY
jgi:ATPase subunit of ABC transporter with duplicated ATPase domains